MADTSDRETLLKELDAARNRVSELEKRLSGLSEALENCRSSHAISTFLPDSDPKHELQRFSVIYKHSPLGIILFRSDGTIVDCNDRFVELMGSTRERLIGFNTANQSTNPIMRNAIKKALAGSPEVFEDEYTSVTGGRTTHLRVVFNPVHPGVSPTEVIATLEDVTDRVLGERKLRESEERYRQLFEHNSSGVFLHDLIYDENDRATDYVITEANPRGLDILGFSPAEILNKPATQAFGVPVPPYLDIYARVASTGDAEQFETFFEPMNRHFSILVYSYRSGSFATVFDDITERKRLEENMVQTEKMMSVGGLAAGMAHEINNPLAGILGSVQVLRQRLHVQTPKSRTLAEKEGLDPDTLVRFAHECSLDSLMDTIQEAGTRASKIVSDMLKFAHKGGGYKSHCDIPDLLDKTLEMASQDYDLKRKYDFKDIEIQREYQDGLPTVRCDASQLQQVFLNLLSNGAQAMSGKEYGPSSRPRFMLRVASDTESIRIEIGDNGPGMEEGVRNRIFEPFFTTKEVGQGTGLGLSVSFFIITRNHNGSIRCESVPGQGTSFIIHLPLDTAQVI